MKNIMHKFNLIYHVLCGSSITMIKQDNELVVDAGHFSTKYIKEAASVFFKSAYLLDSKK